MHGDIKRQLLWRLHEQKRPIRTAEVFQEKRAITQENLCVASTDRSVLNWHVTLGGRSPNNQWTRSRRVTAASGFRLKQAREAELVVHALEMWILFVLRDDN